MKRTLVRLLAIAMLVPPLSSCGDPEGACVSERVLYDSVPRVYCHDPWDEGECDANDSRRTNGSAWTFFAGQSCADLGLDEGSNARP